MKPRLLSLVAALLAAACSPVDSAWLIVDRDGSDLQLRLWNHNRPGCPALPGGTATVDGVEMERVAEGGTKPGGFGGSYCEQATWRIAGHTVRDAITRFEIRSAGQTVRAAFHEVFATRSAQLVDPPDGLLRPGQPIVIQWSPETDDLDAHPESKLWDVSLWQFDPDGIRFQGGREGGDLVTRGSRIETTLLDASWYTEAPLTVSATYSAGVAECVGVEKCLTWESAEAVLDATWGNAAVP